MLKQRLWQAPPGAEGMALWLRLSAPDLGGPASSPGYLRVYHDVLDASLLLGFRVYAYALLPDCLELLISVPGNAAGFEQQFGGAGRLCTSPDQVLAAMQAIDLAPEHTGSPGMLWYWSSRLPHCGEASHELLSPALAWLALGTCDVSRYCRYRARLQRTRQSLPAVTKFSANSAFSVAGHVLDIAVGQEHVWQ